MEPADRVKVDREKQRTLSELFDGFEELARRFSQCQNSLVLGQPLDGPRRDVDSVLSIQAGLLVLIALDYGYLKVSSSAARDPRIRFMSQLRDLTRIRQGHTEGDKQKSELAVWSLNQNDFEPTYYPGDYLAVIEKAAPSSPSQRLEESDTLLEQFNECLDTRTELRQFNSLYAWWVFLRYELIPQNEIHFRCDWRERLPMFDSRVNTSRNSTSKAPGKTQDEQFRFCIQARAEIYATSCRTIAKLLRAEIHTRQSEIGSAAGDKQKRRNAGSRRSNEELFKAALRKHHGYESDGSVLNFAPISARGIETLMGHAISDTTAGRLLKKHFGTVKKYQEACFSKAIGPKLVVLLGDGLHAFGTFDSTRHDAEDFTDSDGE